jgi:hypothetical protein
LSVSQFNFLEGVQMNLYSIALFFHVVGALGFFIALGLEWFNLSALQRTTTAEQVGEWFETTGRLRWLAGVSMLIILIAGFYMTFAAWGGAMWIAVAFGAMILQGVLAGVLTTPRMRAIQKAASSESGSISPTLDGLLHHPLLWVSMLTRSGIALGIIFLMTVKPALTGSLVTVAVGIVVGLAFSMLTMGSRRGQPLAA